MLLENTFIFFKTMVITLYKVSKLKLKRHMKNPLGLFQSVYDYTI
jgi:hypothetical protein